MSNENDTIDADSAEEDEDELIEQLLNDIECEEIEYENIFGSANQEMQEVPTTTNATQHHQPSNKETKTIICQDVGKLALDEEYGFLVIKEEQVLTAAASSQAIEQEEKLAKTLLKAKQQENYRIRAGLNRLTRHLEDISMKIHACDLCQVTFFDESLLNRHKRIHSYETPLACEYCNAKFFCESTLKRHKMQHGEFKRFVCEVEGCGKSFSRKFNRDLHHNIHTGSTPFSCSYENCKKSFGYQSALVLHQRTHTDERPFSCDVCSRRFAAKQNMRIHMRTHTGEKPFSCASCGKLFSSNRNLREHQRIHTGEKPYACDYENCSEVFTHIWSLKVHKRKHVGEQPFSCPWCTNKKFWQKSNLKKHLESHEADIPFRCTVCDQQFTRKFCLNQHLKVHNRGGNKIYAMS